MATNAKAHACTHDLRSTVRIVLRLDDLEVVLKNIQSGSLRTCVLTAMSLMVVERNCRLLCSRDVVKQLVETVLTLVDRGKISSIAGRWRLVEPRISRPRRLQVGECRH